MKVSRYTTDVFKANLEITVIDVVSGKTTPWDRCSDLDEGINEVNDSIDADTELEQLSNYVENSISCLLRIWFLIQKPRPHARFISSGRFDTSFHQRWDEDHVREKFKNISEWLVVRLGKANTRRRQFLEDRKSHNETIKSPQSTIEDEQIEVSSIPFYIKNNESFQKNSRISDDGSR